ncbi:MAG: 4-hydroxyphenylacetate 3-hydroxylase C-terminal domain-containing protein, partial [Stellaceae bacterium]
RGARILATLGPLADEIGVYSPRMGRHTESHSPFALSFAIPCGAKGLRFLCRDSVDPGGVHFDHPLATRFEEMDCVVFFDDVLVPWERVFLLGDVDRLNATANATHSSVHSAHQGAAKNLAKCEFVLGVALLMTQTLGNAHLPHVEERIGELMLTTQLTRACMRAAEADAQLDEWGVMTPDPLLAESPRNLFMTAYPRMIEIIQLLGSSSFLLTPSKADFKGPLGHDIEQFLATDSTGALDRVKLFRLAWDLAGSAFGSRQVLYERFFASDPLTRARAIATIYPKQEVMDRVLDFLGRDDDHL